MKDELVVTPAPAQAGRSIPPARPRQSGSVPTIAAGRAAILDELEKRAAVSTRYADWPEQVPGVPIGFLPGHAGPLCCNLDTHRLVLGKSGAGKATAVICPMLLHDDGYAVVLVDPKNGSVARVTAGYRQTLGPVHIVDPYNMTGFFDAHPCARFNPLDVLDPNGRTLVEDAANLASALCYKPQGSGGKDRFWDETAKKYTTDLILHLVTAPGERADLLRLWELLTMPADDFQAVIAAMQRNPACDGTVMRAGYAMERHSRSATTTSDSFGDVFATIRSYISWIEFQQLRSTCSKTTFSFADMRERGGTVYIVMEDDRLDDCASWVRLMLQSARLGLKRSTSRRPVHFVIDEAAALGRLDLITTGLRAWREARITLHLFYQGVGQLEDAFGAGWKSTISTDALQFMGCNPGDTDTAEYISRIFGERDTIVPTVGDGTSTTTGTNKSSATGRSVTETVGTSTTETDTTTYTVGSSWSTTTGTSVTIGSSSSTSKGAGSTWGSNYSSSNNSSTGTGSSTSVTTSFSDTAGGSSSKATGTSTARGSSYSKAIGHTTTDTEGSSESKGTSENRTFTVQLRKRLRTEQVRAMPSNEMIVIVSDCEPAIVHREHYYRNPRMVARALLRFDPSRPGPIARGAAAGEAVKQLSAPKLSFLGSLVDAAFAVVTKRK